jgi:hypothetical protein
MWKKAVTVVDPADVQEVSIHPGVYRPKTAKGVEGLAICW